MAKDKKSFVLYSDLVHTIEKLINKDRENGSNNTGELFYHILQYVNDQEPKPVNDTVELVFEPIKQQLKRDLQHWEEVKKVRTENGKKGGRPKKPKKANGLLENQEEAKKAVNDNVNVNVSANVNDNDIYNKKDFLADWNELRSKHLKKPSHLNSLSVEDISNLSELSKDNSRDNFREAMVGLFKQKKLPNNNSQMQSNPKHFLTHFNSYLTAFHDKNNSLYGKYDYKSDPTAITL